MSPTILKGSIRSFIVGLLSLFVVACGGGGQLSDGSTTEESTGTYTLGASLQNSLGVADSTLGAGEELNLVLALQLNDEGAAGEVITVTNSDSTLATLSSSSITTDSDGMATIILTGGNTAGTGSLTITSDLSGLSELNVSYVSTGEATTSDSSSVYLIPSSTEESEYANISNSSLSVISAVSPATLLVKVFDATGNPVVNQLVTFDLSAVDGLVTNASADKQNGTTVTDANGFATLNLNVGSTSGAGRITVNLEDGSELSINISSAGLVGEGGTSNVYTAYLVPTTLAETEYPNVTGSTMTTLSSSNPGKVLIGAFDSEGNPLTQQIVSITLAQGSESLATINNDTGTVLTDSNGFADVSLVATDVSGAGTVNVTFFDGSVQSLNFESVGDGNQEAAVDIGSIELLANSFQLASSASDKIELIALVKDNKNNLLPDVRVSFEATSGGIEVIESVTTSGGVATALLDTRNNPETRDITVSAFVNDQVASVTISVIGTSVKLVGSNSIVTGKRSDMSVSLLDSDGNGISQRRIFLNSDSNNALETVDGSALPVADNGSGTVLPYVMTDTTGNAQFTYVAGTSGEDTLSAIALGASTDYTISVSPDNFTITADNEEVPMEAGSDFTLTWQKDGAGFVGDVLLSSTRGQILDSAGDVVTGPISTDTNGEVTVKLVSTNAGPAILTAKADGLTATQNLEFIAEKAHQIDLQSSPFSIGPNGQKSTISAVVRDKDGNLVKNRPVNFSLFDVSGGSIFPATDVTDSNGLATTVYTSNAVSANQGVVVAACTDLEGEDSTCRVTQNDLGNENVQDDTFSCSNADSGGSPLGCLTDDVRLTVADRELFITLGTGNTIGQANEQEYEKVYSIIVTDAESNPVEGVELTVSALPETYNEGFWIAQFDEDDEFEQYVPFITGQCQNEDIDRDGVLDRIEDVDGDGTQDLFNEDLDNDGRLDLSNEDQDLDGNLDVNEDLDSDGNLDFNEDIDGDNNHDLFYEYVSGACSLDDPNNVDTNNDGNLDVGEDRNCNGLLDTGEDTNGNGILDLTEDLDGDGRFDRQDEDVDLDGKLDTVNEDIDGDGRLDTFPFFDGVNYGRDLDGSGSLEASNSLGLNEINVIEDIDGDGNLDVIEYDYNGDGVVDESGINEDFNRNGMLEPGNVVSVIGDLITDENGSTTVGLRYAESYGAWVTVKLVVRAKVAGTEYQDVVEFTLPYSGDDVTDEQNPPTSNLFGSDGNCATPN